MGACRDEFSRLLQGKVSDKVRVSDQPDVVSSLAEWFVAFSLNSFFLLPGHSETLKPQPGFWLLIRSAPRSQNCWWCPVQWLSGVCRSLHLADLGRLCKRACVYLKTCCPTDSLHGEMGFGSSCCQALGLWKSYSRMKTCLCLQSHLFWCVCTFL